MIECEGEKRNDTRQEVRFLCVRASWSLGRTARRVLVVACNIGEDKVAANECLVRVCLCVCTCVWVPVSVSESVGRCVCVSIGEHEHLLRFIFHGRISLCGGSSCRAHHLASFRSLYTVRLCWHSTDDNYHHHHHNEKQQHTHAHTHRHTR